MRIAPRHQHESGRALGETRYIDGQRVEMAGCAHCSQLLVRVLETKPMPWQSVADFKKSRRRQVDRWSGLWAAAR
jgi:hypothetical protein